MQKVFLLHIPSFRDRKGCFEAWPAIQEEDRPFIDNGAKLEKLRLVPKNPANRFVYTYMHWLVPIIGSDPAIVIVVIGTRKQVAPALDVEDYKIIGIATQKAKKMRFVFKSAF